MLAGYSIDERSRERRGDGSAREIGRLLSCDPEGLVSTLYLSLFCALLYLNFYFYFYMYFFIGFIMNVTGADFGFTLLVSNSTQLIIDRVGSLFCRRVCASGPACADGCRATSRTARFCCRPASSPSRPLLSSPSPSPRATACSFSCCCCRPYEYNF